MTDTRRRRRARRQRARARRRVAAALAALALVATEALGVAGAARTEARAAEPADAITITSLELYSSGIGMSSEAHGPTGRFEAGGTVVYCADAGLTGPGVGTTLSGRERGGLTLDYILHYGYGGAGYRGNVRGRTGEEAQAITQIAIWCATSAPNGDWERRKLADEGRAFYEEARGSARAGGAYAGSSWIYGPRSSVNQRIVGQTLRTGDLELVKASADPAVSGGSELYSLAGAAYGVYRDQGCGELVTTLTTGADGRARSNGLVIGTYYLREATPPRGYARNDTVYEATVAAGGCARVAVTDAPQVARLGTLVRKVDAETGQALPQGDATLAGAEFTIRHYDGLYDDVSALPESPTHTWVVRTGADGTASLDAAHLVSGDAVLTDADGDAVVPLGTVTVQETRAPEGYLLPADGGITLQRVEATGTARVVGTLTEHVAREEVARGGVRVPKIDHQLAAGTAQGDATLAGAELTIYNRSAGAVTVGGRSVAPGEAALTITTGEDGVATSAADALPFGTYEIRETAAPRGYLLNETWSVTFSVQRDGSVADLAGTPLAEDVARGGARVRKTDAELGPAQGDATLEGAVIAIESACAGPVVVDGVTYQPGDVVATLTTGSDGMAATETAALPFGTYVAREQAAPTGYLRNDDWSQTFTLERDGQVVEVGPLEETVMRGGVRVAKLDRERAEAAPQGDATLAGAELTVYNRSAASVVVGGEKVEPGAAALVITTGEDGVAATAPDALPYGTYEVRETAAPTGYLPDEDWAQTFKVRAHGQVCDLTDDARAVRDQVARGGVELRKSDRELVGAGAEDSSVALGSATLAGAVVELTNVSAHAVLVGDTLFEPGAVVTTLVTDAGGRAATVPDALPFGTYEAREVTPPTGYLLNEDWVRTVRIDADGVVVDLTSDEEAVDDQVIRGDLSFTKAEEGSQRRMADVAFLLTSLTTGERHVLVTDENGMVDTSAAWFAHTSDTNASDAALREDGSVDDAALRADHGVWFSGSTEASTAPDDALGALPFDRYYLEELPCAANEGHRLVATEVTVTRPSVALDLGTMDDETIEPPTIDTTLRCDATSDHDAPSHADSTLTDTVRLDHLQAGRDYVVQGELHLTETGERGDVTSGELVATAEATLTAEAESARVRLSYELPGSQLAGHSVHATARLLMDGRVVATHDDPADEDQTVHLPAIATSARDGNTGSSGGGATPERTLVDEVTLTNLIAGQTYTLRSSVHARDVAGDGTTSDGGLLAGTDGADATAETTFVANASEMTVEVEVPYDGSGLDGRDVVAFEELRDEHGILLALHADIDDTGQTLHVPGVATSAADGADGDKTVTADGEVTVVDTVSYTNLEPGRTYELQATLRRRTTAEDGTITDAGPVLDASGNEVCAGVTFTPEEPEGSIEVPIGFDASGLGDATTVAYEVLLLDGEPVAAHADITDEGQTVELLAPESEGPSGAPRDEEAPAQPGPGGMPGTGETTSVVVPVALAGVAAVGGSVAWRRRRMR